MDLKDYIRSIPDFPKEGILFYDISTLLAVRFGACGPCGPCPQSLWFRRYRRGVAVAFSDL